MRKRLNFTFAVWVILAIIGIIWFVQTGKIPWHVATAFVLWTIYGTYKMGSRDTKGTVLTKHDLRPNWSFLVMKTAGTGKDEDGEIAHYYRIKLQKEEGAPIVFLQ